MGRFGIAFEDNDSFSAKVVVAVGSFQDVVVAPLTFWSRRDYLVQWCEGLRKITEGHERSCLISSIESPNPRHSTPFLWVLYREGQRVFLQNQIVVGPSAEHFRISDPYSSLRKRCTMNEDGERISEWEVTVADIATCLQHLQESI